EFFQRADEGFLERVLGEMAVVEQAHEKVEEGDLVSRQQPFEGVAVAALKASEQFRVAEFRHVRAPSFCKQDAPQCDFIGPVRAPPVKGSVMGCIPSAGKTLTK